ncbi:E3 ubiquitin-protein ligase TRIM39-like [Acipenser ruthenus]|uniref:E3 ubiquitin-protein ligase TRIM39-like n=1 Tax=Acipenser ruthenus TaxID=7906 RepID=UPI001560B82A|nr:E3 ubiquitin-protein ligase TRIM39-like [Acipenser ruthenus]
MEMDIVYSALNLGPGVQTASPPPRPPKKETPKTPRSFRWAAAAFAVLWILTTIITLSVIFFRNSQSSSLFEKYSKLQNQQKEMDKTFSALQKNYKNVNESGILVWKWIRSASVDVTLDVDTANPWLILSEDRKEVKDGNTRHDLPDSPKRFDRVVSVLGKQGFTSGRHYWQVEVGEKTQWTLGVAKESINRTGMIIVSPENGYWTVWLRISSGFRALTNTPTPLPLSLKPRKLGVYLDYEEGQVSFYNVETRSHIFTFSDTFTEKIYPFFSPGLFEQKNEAPLIIYPVSDRD